MMDTEHFRFRGPLANNYYENVPDGSLLMVPIVRSLAEVISEREVVAEYFAFGNEPIKILSGVCDLFKAQLIFEDRGMAFHEMKVPLSMELQHMIDIYNHVTAADVIAQYEKQQLEKEKKRQRRMKRKRPHSSTDRAQPS